MSESEFNPTSEDVQFARDMVSSMKDGGIWHWTATGLRYKFHHQVKALELLNHELLVDPEIATEHNKTVVTWSYLNWKVVPEKFEGVK